MCVLNLVCACTDPHRPHLGARRLIEATRVDKAVEVREGLRAQAGQLVRADDSEIVSACWRGHVAVARVSIYLAEAIKLVSCLIVIVCGAWRVAIVVVPCIVYILVAVAIMEVVTRSSIVSRREIFLRWPIASRRGIVVRGLAASRWAGAILVLGEFSHSLFLFNLSFQRSGIFLLFRTLVDTLFGGLVDMRPWWRLDRV